MTVAADEVVIRCCGVVKRFGDVVALDELDLAVGRGTVVGYLGPNGAGKPTTLLAIVTAAVVWPAPLLSSVATSAPPDSLGPAWSATGSPIAGNRPILEL